MALADLQAQLKCLYGPEAETRQRDAHARGLEGSATCAAGVSFPPAVAAPVLGATWIATDEPPVQVSPWPPQVPVPLGWHAVDAVEARRLQGLPLLGLGKPVTVQSLSSRVAALSTADSLADAVADRRRPRTPREARFARVSRLPRIPRDPRLPKPARAPRAPRVPRPKRPPRAKRTDRPRRPPFRKTKYEPGLCKGPGCTCWTPAGCSATTWVLAQEQVRQNPGLRDCYRGPCYDYVACVEHKCGAAISCVIHQILRFWIRQYEALPAWVTQSVAAAQEFAQPVIQPLAVVLPGLSVLSTAPVPVAAGDPGCPPGYVWYQTLTGIHCGPPGGSLPRADPALVAAVLAAGQAKETPRP